MVVLKQVNGFAVCNRTGVAGFRHVARGCFEFQRAQIGCAVH